MIFEETSIYNEVKRIIASGSKPVNNYLTAMIHTPKGYMKAGKVLNFDISRDYALNYMDECTVSLVVPGGTFIKDIYPDNKNLEITVMRQSLDESGGDRLDSAPVVSERYKAILITNQDFEAMAQEFGPLNKDQIDLTSMITVQFQLFQKTAFQLKMASTGGIFRDALVGDVIKSLLTEVSNNMLDDSPRKIKGVNMVDADNVDIRKHINIPQGTPVSEVAGYIQVNAGGVYKTNLGCYLQNSYWYVYPLANFERFDSANKVISFYVVPKSKFPNLERTYRTAGDHVVALCTAESNKTDGVAAMQVDSGNAVMYANAETFIDSFATAKDNKVTANRSKNNSEYVVNERKDGLQNQTVSPRGVTANNYYEQSQLAMRGAGTFSLTWENSNPSLIVPGMPIKIFYYKGDKLVIAQGVVLKADHFYSLVGKGATSDRHGCVSAIHAAIKAV